MTLSRLLMVVECVSIKVKVGLWAMEIAQLKLIALKYIKSSIILIGDSISLVLFYMNYHMLSIGINPKS